MAEKNIPSDPGIRPLVGRLIGVGIVAAAIISVIVWLIQWEIRPETEDATVRANFIGVAPQVSGHIIELHVYDNQRVQEGDLLFVIDPRPYKIALERARATLALTRTEVDALKSGAVTAVAGVSRAKAQLNASAAEVNRREMDPVRLVRPPPPPNLTDRLALYGALVAAIKRLASEPINACQEAPEVQVLAVQE